MAFGAPLTLLRRHNTHGLFNAITYLQYPSHQPTNLLTFLPHLHAAKVSSSYLTEVDFLARVEAAERRDNMSANPGADPAALAPKYSLTSASSSARAPAALPASAPAAVKAQAQRAPKLQQRTSPQREHRIHDETGGAALRAMAQGRAPNSQRAGRAGRAVQGTPRNNVPRGTPRPGASPAAHSRETTPRLRAMETTPRPYVSAHGIGGRLTHAAAPQSGGTGSSSAIHRLPTSVSATAAAPSAVSERRR